MTGQADLHIHTHFSDSTQSPREVAEAARTCGLSAIAITDHDTVEGIRPTVEAAKAFQIEVISGIELSSEINGKDVHILGYLFDTADQAFIGRIRYMQNTRLSRMGEMIDKLKALGIDNITAEEVCALAQSDSVGRPHLATILKEKGWVQSSQEAFDKYLADGAPAYVPKFRQTPLEAITMIKQAGGIAVLAHPMLTGVDGLIPGFVEDGLGGIEVYYPNQADSVTAYYEGIARKHKLAMTGGSDAHGAVKKHTHVGKMTIPYDLVERLKEVCHLKR